MIDFLGRQGLARRALFNGNTIPTTVFIENGIDGFPEERIVDEGIEIFGEFIPFPGIKEVQESQLKWKYFIHGDIVVLPGLYTLLKKPEDLLERILKTREEVGFRKIIFAPFLAIPETVPIFHYLGIDILDNGRGMMLDIDPHEYSYMENIVKKFMEKGELRVLVESIPDTLSKTLLRLSDSLYQNIFEIYYPVTGNALNSSHFESLFRPDIVRWRERIIKRYRKPSFHRYILLLPCSAVKPYSRSPSHRYFRSLIESSGKVLHEVIVTSPLGLVPRELEFTYPAAHYDIPVTGRWYGEEKEFTEKMLHDFLENNKYERIIAFLPDDLRFLSPFLQDLRAVEIFGNLRNDENRNMLLEELSKLEKVREVYADILNSISSFQFGVQFPLNGKKIRKRYDEIIAYEGDEIYIHFLPSQGKIILGKEAADFLYSKSIYTVEIDNFVPRGSIFVRGIRNASPDIREGDEVVIVSSGKIIGTGTATMSFKDMISQEHGEAVKVRKIFSA